jgi:predicted dehydrogenase
MFMSLLKNTDRRIRYGVVGLGHIAQTAILPAFKHARENSELVALFSGDGEKRAVLKEKYDLEHCGTYDELEESIRNAALDAVYIAVPNHLHRELAERAMNAGAHVLCEKPLAMTSEECGLMIQAAMRTNRKLMTAYRLHFVEGALQAMKLAASGNLGELRTFSSVFSHQVRPGDIRTRPEVGGGALFDLGPYPVNTARHLFQSEPIEVFAWQVPQAVDGQRGVDETTSAILRFPKDRIAQFTVCQTASSVDRYTLTGTRGDLRVQDGYEYAGSQTHFVTIDGKTRTNKYASLDQFAPQLIHFSNCVLDGKEPEPSGREGLADVLVLEALALSAQTGRPVHLPTRDLPSHPNLDQAMWRPPVRKEKTVNAPAPSKE